MKRETGNVTNGKFCTPVVMTYSVGLSSFLMDKQISHEMACWAELAGGLAVWALLRVS